MNEIDSSLHAIHRAGRRLFAWALACSVIACGCVLSPPSHIQLLAPSRPLVDSRETDTPASLRVTTFNVWGLPSWLNGASSERFPEIARELEHMASDIVLLQEVWTRRSFAALSESSSGCERAWWTASARRRGTFFGQNGLLTLSKFPIAGAEVKYFSSAHLPDSLMNKAALKITVVVPPGLRVDIWNVHLQDGASPRVRSRQIAELIGWMDKSRDGQVADIVGGDFNFTPGSEEFRRFVAAIGPDVHQLARDEAFPTWDGLKPTPEAGQTLDHIFVRLRQPGDEVGAQAKRIFAAARLKDRLSDHMGMEALLTFRGVSENDHPILIGQRAEAYSLESPF